MNRNLYFYRNCYRIREHIIRKRKFSICIYLTYTYLYLYIRLIPTLDITLGGVKVHVDILRPDPIWQQLYRIKQVFFELLRQYGTE